MKTAELAGAALDWAVARCEKDAGHLNYIEHDPYLGLIEMPYPDSDVSVRLRYSINWSQGGPIIERDLCELVKCKSGSNVWWESHSGIEGTKGHAVATGPTPLIAAMRCYVASKLGDEVEIPEELL
jgi:Protein of unknown function (DUF2591)